MGACSLRGRDLSATHKDKKTAQSCPVVRQSCGRLELWWEPGGRGGVRQGRIEVEAKGVTKEERSPATSYPEQKYSTAHGSDQDGAIGWCVLELAKWAENRELPDYAVR